MRKNSVYHGWWNVLVCLLIMGIVYASFSSCQGLFVKPVTEELNVDRGSFSAMITIASIGLILGSAFMGKILIKYSIKKVMVLSTLIVSLCMFGFSISTNIIHFYIIGLVMGIAFAGATTIPVTVIINNWFGASKKGLAMSLAFAGSGVGGMFLTMILNNFIISYGWRMAYRVNALIMLVIIIPLIIFVIVASPKDKGVKRIRDIENVEGAKSGVTLEEAKKTSTFWMICISFMIIAMVNVALLNHVVPYLSDIGFSDVKAANISAVAVGSLTLGKIVLGYTCDKLGIKKGSLISNTCLLLATASLLLVVSNESIIYLYVALYCIGGTAATICPPLFVAKLFGEIDYGRLVGMLSVATGLGAALGAVLCGKLYDMAGNYTLAWSIFSICSVIALLLQVISLKGSNKNNKIEGENYVK